MERVSRSELYTDLEKRIKHMHRFLEWSQDDINAMIAAQKYVKEAIPMLTDKVYDKLLKQDITARVFHTHDSRVEIDPEVFLKPTDPGVAMRKMFVRWYLTKLNSDPTSMEYWEYLNKVGRLHVAQGKSKSVFVEYALLGICMGYIHGLVIDTILNHPALDFPTKTAVLKAMTKVIWIQNDLMARWHTEENKEYQITVSQTTPSLPTPPQTSGPFSDELPHPTHYFESKQLHAQRAMKCPFTGQTIG